MALQENAFEKAGVTVHWQDIPEGTGRMCKMLREDKLDVACILTDGLVKDQLAGNPAKIIQGYVKSPLEWGIFAFAKAELNHVSQVQNPHFAISRMGSGSHLMSYFLARRENWPSDSLDFTIVDTLEGAVEELQKENGADLFLWEKHMTQPLVDRGIFKLLGTISGDWPSFVLAATPEALDRKVSALERMLDVINNYTFDFRKIPMIEHSIASFYRLDTDTVQEWLGQVRFTQQQIDQNLLNQLMEGLRDAGIIQDTTQPSELLAKI